MRQLCSRSNPEPICLLDFHLDLSRTSSTIQTILEQPTSQYVDSHIPHPPNPEVKQPQHQDSTTLHPCHHPAPISPLPGTGSDIRHQIPSHPITCPVFQHHQRLCLRDVQIPHIPPSFASVSFSTLSHSSSPSSLSLVSTTRFLLDEPPKL
ncbi:hypothetical protein BJ508DRAFT_103896 [Ascobolus immersus RN42]|uniref:Uncharacterized protein n=1 Tax=Ascobolus immersus RN42 TaxID=1160509 RepID=A0A3N4HBM0_ASCIM|nr:hypothetical protein BJ508DRAFT_103896 [Ascobolus immersus RN42]